MRILFVDGHLTHNNRLCIIKNGRIICGHYHSERTRYYKTVFYNNKKNCKVLDKVNVFRLIQVVKQKSRWDTFMILYHELAHWLFDMLPEKLRDRCDDWLDRK